MNDEEKDLRELVAVCQHGSDTAIKWAKRNKRMRLAFVAANAVVWALFLILDICLRKYFSCAFDILVGGLIIKFTWGIWDKNLEDARKWKRVFAQDKLKAEKRLQQYLEYKERGFE